MRFLLKISSIHRHIILFGCALVSCHHVLTAQEIPARQFVEKNLSEIGLQQKDFQDAVVSDSYSSGGIQFFYFNQFHRGLRVFNGLMNVITSSNKVTHITGNRFIQGIEEKAKGLNPIIHPEIALKHAYRHLNIPVANLSFEKISEQKGNSFEGSIEHKVLFKANETALEDIPAELFWLESESTVKLVWNIRIKQDNDWWEIRIDAVSGAYIEKNNWVAHCSFESCHKNTPMDQHIHSPGNQSTEASMAANDYLVYDLPLESPIAGGRTTVNSPWNKAGAGNKATTLKWHSDGTTTYTNTRGNNVFAKEDLKADNETSIGYSPSSSSSEYVYNIQPNVTPTINADAAITNLFYWNNICHDIFYQYGFDEPSGNFQQNNLGRGGAASDFVYADAMDGSGKNNANFATPPDGSKPRMQMFLWSGTSSSMKINSPSSIAGIYQAGLAYFNPLSPPSVTGNVIMSSPADGCGTITNATAVAGKIAIINRGNCTFITKVKNAQNAGAIGVIIVNNVSGTPPNMSGTDNTINIISCSVSDITGNIIKTALQSGAANATISANPSSTDIDADYDNGVIVHEYGHGISTRLTGGPSNSSCLGNAEQMGEGWSDYFALMLGTDWTKAKPNDARAIGNYVIGQGLTGPGIREFPYSYNMTLSPYNYDYARTNTSVHDLGSAWAAMLWDVTWNIIAMEPPSSDLFNGSGGNNIALRLVMLALKLQPCSPGFVDGRDAILKADEILYNNAHRCAIWNAFARRGLGLKASQGLRTDATDGVQSFESPPDLGLTVTPSLSEAKQGDIIDFNLDLRSDCSESKGMLLTATLSPKLDFVSSPNGVFDPANRLVSFPLSDVLIAQTNTHTIKTKVNTSFLMPSKIFFDDVESGTSKWKSLNITNNGAQPFSISIQNVHSPTKAWFVPATKLPSQITLTMASPVNNLPGNSVLSFWHYHKIEATGDGGIVEISTDNGSSWQDLGTKIIKNGYNTVIGNTDNLLKGRSVFGGEVAMRKTSINLSAYEGKNPLIRFRYGSDTENGALPDATGWFIDDIQISTGDTCILLQAAAKNSVKTVSGAACIDLIAENPVITMVETNGDKGQINVFPNPVDGILTIELPNETKEIDIRLLSMTGQLLKTIHSFNAQKLFIDLKDLPASAYLLEVRAENDLHLLRKVLKY